jgi:hypothetical protein
MRFTLPKLFLIVAMLALACGGMMYSTSLWADSIFTLSLGMFVVALLRAIGLRGPDRVFAVVFGLVGLIYLLLITVQMFYGLRESLLTNYPLAWGAKITHLNSPQTYQPPFYAPSTIYSAPIPAPATSSGTISGDAVAPQPAMPSAESSDPMTTDGSGTISPPVTIPPPTLTPVPAAVATTYIPVVPQYTIKTLISYGLSFGNEGMPIAHFFLIGHCVWSWLFAVLAAWFAGRMYDRRMKTVAVTSQVTTS